MISIVFSAHIKRRKNAKFVMSNDLDRGSKTQQHLLSIDWTISYGQQILQQLNSYFFQQLKVKKQKDENRVTTN